jgi:4-hydroxyphenylpyruvate dioxygenase-like putative hemolysin
MFGLVARCAVGVRQERRVPSSVSTRIDHLAWVVFPHNIERYREQLTQLFGFEFLRHPEPRSLGPDTQIYISFAGGLELVAPQGQSTPAATRFSAALAEQGEMPMACVMRVPSVEEAADRIRAAGYDVGPNVLDPDEDARRASLASWTQGVADMVEHPIQATLPGTALSMTQLEFESEPPAYAERVARIDRVAWVVDPGNVVHYVGLLETLFETPFARDTSVEEDVTSYVSWDGGLELLAPIGASSDQASELTARLAYQGEGLYSVAIAVDDLGATVLRAKELGLPVADEATRRDGADELVVADFIGCKLIASEPTTARRLAMTA